MFVLGQQFISLRAENTLADELVDDHVRSLMVSHLTDVTATDQQTVKPWFEGKLDFAPPVKDPAGQGFPLRGCRLDYLDRRPVAVCVYQRRGHWINLFIMPAEKVREATPQPSTHRGFNILTWASAGMSFYAVSDLSSAELNDFGFAFSKL
jgi:anti-sigma factor RsiW